LATTKERPDFDTLLQALFRGQLTELQAMQLAALGPEAVRLTLLAANERFAR